MRIKFFFNALITTTSVLFNIVSYANSDLVTYANQAYQFKIEYPKTLPLEHPFATYYLVPQNWRYGTASETGKGIALVSIPIIHIKDNSYYPHYYSVEVRIGASNDPIAINNCIKGGTNTKIINNTTFYTFPFNDQSMMQYVSGISYRTLHNNQCYAIEQLKTGAVRMTEPNSHDLSDQTLESYYKQAAEIIETFRFM